MTHAKHKRTIDNEEDVPGIERVEASRQRLGINDWEKAGNLKFRIQKFYGMNNVNSNRN
jgi:hypothetical protein